MRIKIEDILLEITFTISSGPRVQNQREPKFLPSILLPSFTLQLLQITSEKEYVGRDSTLSMLEEADATEVVNMYLLMPLPQTFFCRMIFL